MLTSLKTKTMAQIKGPSSSQTPYITAVETGIQTTSILTTPDLIGGYRMVGIPDGLGAFNNGDGTFTLLMNHELGNTSGAVRAHGSTGAFVSKWIINKTNLAVISGSDLIKNVNLWNGSGYATFNATNPSTLARFGRLCSADLPAMTAFYNSSTGKGTQERIYMNGEENGVEGRGMAHIVTGPNSGTSYELPYLGKFSWENSVANPATGDKTVVAGLDDATPGQVYFYIGTKTTTGTEIEKAGLSNGNLYGPAVTGMLVETSASFPAPVTPFTMINLGDVHNLTGATLNTNSITAGVSQFLRPEDGAWDPRHPEDFYFVTTNAFNSPSRLWRMHFTNLNDLTQGGVITAVLDGTEGQQMFDNIAIDHWGHILLQEDVGNNAHLGKIWQYTIATDELKQICSHDVTRFLNGGTNFLTQDEEGSGIIDVQEILGAGMFLMVDQAHYTIAGDAVEGGQLLALFNPDTYNACASYTGNISVSPSPTVPGQAANTIYLGYGPQSLTLSAAVPSGFPPYTYSWSPGGSTNSSMTVNPTSTTTYNLTIKNAFGCAVSISMTIAVKDIRDGDKNKVFLCHNGHTQSVSVNAVPVLLSQGDQLGNCDNEPTTSRSLASEEGQIQRLKLYPNPVTNSAIISLQLQKDEHVQIAVFDQHGRKAMKEIERNYKGGSQEVVLNTSHLSNGSYYARITCGSTVNLVKMVVIR
jgi:hypothetical protein